MTDLNERLAGLSADKRALLMQQLSRQGATTKAAIVAQPRPDRPPLSSTQQRLWILDRIMPGSAVYNLPSCYWLDGPVDAAALQRALDEVVRRHESLRTVIASDDDGPYQRVLSPSPVPLEFRDLLHLPAEQREECALANAREQAAQPLDISHGPIFRARLWQVAADRQLLLLNVHHIASDGWSLTVLRDELRRLYVAYAASQPSPLAEPTLQYIDYALWQHEQLQTPALQAQLDYWTERLSGPLPVLQIAGDRPRPPVQSYRGAVLRDLLPAVDYEAAKRLGRKHGATPFMTLMAAFNVLLLRYSGQDDQIVGVGIANRSRVELESLIGFFVNTLALRTDMSNNPTFSELLRRVKDNTLAAYANQDAPIERIIENLDLDRALSHSPLFQAMLFFQNFPLESSEEGLSMSPVEFDRMNQGSARADMSLFAAETTSGLTLFFEYASDLFDEATVKAMSRHLQQLLRAAVSDPEQPIGELSLLAADERRQLLQHWNATERVEPALEAPVHALFESQAMRTPNAIAVESGNDQLSYAELDRQASALARTLAAQGIQTGERVGLYTERSPRMLVAMLAVLKAGAAYVPLDPAFPAQRLAFMLRDSGARLLVTEQALADQVPESEATILLIEDALASDDLGTADAARESQEVAGPDDPAYVIFTSGSTGHPKGVQIPHRAAVNFLTSVAREPGLTDADTMCAVTTLAFDIAVLELLLPLSVGARIVLADHATASDGKALAALLERSGATVMQATPTSWRMLLESGWRGNPRLRALSGGEALSRELADRLLACTSELWNMYGPTETTVWSTLQRVTAGEDTISIGRPLANTQVYVVDAQLQPVPVGVPGELLIGGLGMADGYLGRPELTAEKFITDPFSGHDGARLYRTGDLARWRRDGTLEVLGRGDNQIKLRGFRIEPGEIEAVLEEHPSVGHAAVICREDRPGDQRLIAYVVPVGNTPPENALLRDLARSRLPDYMVPALCVVLDQLPTTPNGKLDRSALPAPETEVAKEYVGPRNRDEELLADLWAEVLGVERVGVHESFFDLGGHSLLATKLVTRAQQLFGGDIGLRVLFEAPTVAAFAERLLHDRTESLDTDALESMLDQLEGFSAAEIQALLTEADS